MSKISVVAGEPDSPLSREPNAALIRLCSQLVKDPSDAALLEDFQRKTGREPTRIRIVSERLIFPRKGETLILAYDGIYYLPRDVVCDICIIAASPNAYLATNGHSHPLWVASSAVVSLYNIHFKLDGPSSFAAVGVEGALEMFSCTIDQVIGEAGIMVAGVGASVYLEDCLIQNTDKQAIEVRKGATLRLNRTIIKNCFQGVIAYGGAAMVDLQHCLIENCKMEGLLFQGSTMNAATQAQQSLFPQSRNVATSDAVAWGRQAGVNLVVNVENSAVKNCLFGFSIDYGCKAKLHRCLGSLSI